MEPVGGISGYSDSNGVFKSLFCRGDACHNGIRSVNSFITGLF